MAQIDFWTNLVANLLTIIVSGIALYVFFFNREKITSAINFILNYSNQLTLTDLKFKIEKLNEYNSNDPDQKKEVINILHEIEGQILGNKNLKEKLKEQLDKIVIFTCNSKLLTEPKKRSLVSELKESIRNLDASNYNDIINSNKGSKR
ncbi:MAG: hypothetical protein V4511_14055 [Bacteroidota bacterium]